MTSALEPRRFPELVWSHPVLVALDERGRSELESAGALRDLRVGERLFSAGDPADVLFVVVSGELAVSASERALLRRGEGRRACAGDVVGEEAAARPHASRRADAVCERDARVAALPAPLLRRVIARGGQGDVGRRAQRWLVRALASDALRVADFAGDLPARERDVLLDAGRAVELRRGDALFRQGDLAEDAFFLVEGILQLVAEEGEVRRVIAYHGSGDLLGEAAGARAWTAVATSDAWLFAVPIDVFGALAARHADALSRALRVRGTARSVQRDVRANATRHVLADLARFETSRSLLAIDQEACLRCGHCAWSCSASHADGVSRLLRRGDVIVATVRDERQTLLLPSSCQHCKNPACMIDCPTGAIGRDEHGEVYIREDLCTGCGSCAKACPWDNIRMVPRPVPSDRHQLPVMVAVKCDLCRERSPDGEPDPACVSACPTGAVLRIDPTEAFEEVRAVLGKKVGAASGAARAPARSPLALAMLAAASLAAFGVYALGRAMPRGYSGALLLGLVLALGGYGLVKRFAAHAPRSARRLVAGRPHYLAHLGLGVLSFGVAAAHARPNEPGASALGLAVFVTGALGVVAALLGVAVPRRLTALERAAILPEQTGERGRELDARLFRDLTGKSDLLKGLYARVLRPFARSPWVLARMVVLAPPQRASRERLTERVVALVGAADDERLEGLEGLVALVVERQALRAQRVLHATMRGAAFTHVVLAVGLALLVVMHLVAQVRP
ncbi:MAG TPA: cyclic nucleotide-binding domain-containing protein [Polyangiaceae bacterium]|nr:cyclic nucleotide-binding domain-containing protein [Polyangiaceae bacterium]